MTDQITSIHYHIGGGVLYRFDDMEDYRIGVLINLEATKELIGREGHQRLLTHYLLYYSLPYQIVQLSLSNVKRIDFQRFTGLYNLHIYGLEQTEIKTLLMCRQLRQAQFIDCYIAQDFYLLDCLPNLEALIIANTEASFFPVKERNMYVVIGANNLKHWLPLRCGIEVDARISSQIKLFREFNEKRPKLSDLESYRIARESNAAMAKFGILSAQTPVESRVYMLEQRVAALEDLTRMLAEKCGFSSVQNCQSTAPQQSSNDEVESNNEY